MGHVLADCRAKEGVTGGARRSILLLAAAALLVLPVSAAPGKQAGHTSKKESPAGNTGTGRNLFMKDGCYQCHGTVGQGGVGPRLGPHPLALGAFVAFVRKPAGRGMPPFSDKVLSDAELADIHAYLETIPAPPPVKDIPLLNQ